MRPQRKQRMTVRRTRNNAGWRVVMPRHKQQDMIRILVREFQYNWETAYRMVEQFKTFGSYEPEVGLAAARAGVSVPPSTLIHYHV